MTTDDVRTSYDTVAANYADFVRDAAAEQPWLRGALDLFADRVRRTGGGPVLDAGCGPGQFTAYLRGVGVDARGVDLSPGQVEIARREHPGITFDVGDMTALDAAAGSLAGLLSFWSIVHLADDDLPALLAGFRRVLRPGGTLALGFHAGTGSTLKTSGYGDLPMRVHVVRRPPELVAGLLGDAGFTVEAQLVLDPHGDHPGAILFAS